MLIDLSKQTYSMGAAATANGSALLAEAFNYDFTSDADATASNMRAATPFIAITDTGSNLTTTRTLTLPDVLLASKFSVLNGTGQNITIKAHGDAGPGVTIKPEEEQWLVNYGKILGLPMYLVSASAGELMGGLDALDNTQKATARTRLDVYGKAESDANNSKLNGVRTSTSTATTLVAGDAGGLVRLDDSGGSGSTVVIPLDGTLNFPVLTQISFIDEDADGRRTFEGETGAVTLTVEDGLTLVSGKLNAPFTAIKLAANHWYISGGLASV